MRPIVSLAFVLYRQSRLSRMKGPVKPQAKSPQYCLLGASNNNLTPHTVISKINLGLFTQKFRCVFKCLKLERVSLG